MGTGHPTVPQMLFHRFTLTTSWELLGNIAVIVVLYKYHKFGYFVHATLFWFIVIINIVASLMLLVPLGLKDNV